MRTGEKFFSSKIFRLNPAKNYDENFSDLLFWQFTSTQQVSVKLEMVFFPPTWHVYPLASVSLLSPSPEDMFFSLILQCVHMKTTPHILKIHIVSEGSEGWLLETGPRPP